MSDNYAACAAECNKRRECLQKLGNCVLLHARTRCGASGGMQVLGHAAVQPASQASLRKSTQGATAVDAPPDAVTLSSGDCGAFTYAADQKCWLTVSGAGTRARIRARASALVGLPSSHAYACMPGHKEKFSKQIFGQSCAAQKPGTCTCAALLHCC